MILTIDKYKFDLPYFDEEEKLSSQYEYGGSILSAIPMDEKSKDFVIRFQKSIENKALRVIYGIIEPIDDEFKSDKYKHGLAFIMTDGFLSDGRKVTGLWPSKIDKDESDRYIISFSIDTIM